MRISMPSFHFSRRKFRRLASISSPPPGPYTLFLLVTYMCPIPNVTADIINKTWSIVIPLSKNIPVGISANAICFQTSADLLLILFRYYTTLLIRVNQRRAVVKYNRHFFHATIYLSDAKINAKVLIRIVPLTVIILSNKYHYSFLSIKRCIKNGAPY